VKLTRNQMTLIGAVIGALAVIAAAVIQTIFKNPSNPSLSIHQEGKGNIAIGTSRDVHIDQSKKEIPPEAQLGGLLMPANEPTPSHSCGMLSASDLILFFGGRQTILSGDRELKIIECAGKSLLRLKGKPREPSSQVRSSARTAVL
jgi:hypothetical protein